MRVAIASSCLSLTSGMHACMPASSSSSSTALEKDNNIETQLETWHPIILVLMLQGKNSLPLTTMNSNEKQTRELANKLREKMQTEYVFAGFGLLQRPSPRMARSFHVQHIKTRRSTETSIMPLHSNSDLAPTQKLPSHAVSIRTVPSIFILNPIVRSFVRFLA